MKKIHLMLDTDGSCLAFFSLSSQELAKLGIKSPISRHLTEKQFIKFMMTLRQVGRKLNEPFSDVEPVVVVAPRIVIKKKTSGKKSGKLATHLL